MDVGRELAIQVPVGGGINIGVSHFLMNDTQDVLALNVVTRPVGTYTQRDGYEELFKLQTGEEIRASFQHCIDGTSYIFAISKRRLWRYSERDNVEVVPGVEFESDNVDVEFFEGQILFADEGDLKILDEDTNGVVLFNELYPDAQAPKAKFVDAFKNRVFLSGNPEKPYTLYASNIIDPSKGVADITYIDPATPPNDVDPAPDKAYWLNIPFREDCSSGITAQEKFDDKLYMWSNQELFLWEGRTINSLIPVTVTEGIVNDKAIVRSKYTLAYMGAHGIYRVVENRIEELHIPVDWYVQKAIKSVVNGWGWNDLLFFYIGDVPIYDLVQEEEILDNAVLVYDTLNQTWVIWDNIAASSFTTFYSEGTSYLLFGGIDGSMNIFKPGLLTDRGKDLNVDIRSKVFYLGSLNTVKKIDTISLFSRNGCSTKVRIRGVNNKFDRQYTDLGETFGAFDTVSAEGKFDSQCRGFQLRFSKLTASEKVVYEGWSIIYMSGGLARKATT